MALDFEGDPGAEMSYLVNQLNVDGFFCDSALTASAWWHAQQKSADSSQASASFVSKPVNALAVTMFVIGVVLCIVVLVIAGWAWHDRHHSQYYHGLHDAAAREEALHEEANINGSQDLELQRLRRDAAENSQT